MNELESEFLSSHSLFQFALSHLSGYLVFLNRQARLNYSGSVFTTKGVFSVSLPTACRAHKMNGKRLQTWATLYEALPIITGAHFQTITLSLSLSLSLSSLIHPLYLYLYPYLLLSLPGMCWCSVELQTAMCVCGTGPLCWLWVRARDGRVS